MTNIESFKEVITQMVSDCVANIPRNGMFKTKFNEIFTDDDESSERISGTVIITFNYGNIERNHIINVGWNDVDDYGFEDNDGELSKISTAQLLVLMYYDLALDGLADEYLE